MNTCECDTTGVASYSNRLIGGMFSGSTVNCAVHTAVTRTAEDFLSSSPRPDRDVRANSAPQGREVDPESGAISV
jgi:hypothetical protein